MNPEAVIRAALLPLECLCESEFDGARTVIHRCARCKALAALEELAWQASHPHEMLGAR